MKKFFQIMISSLILIGSMFVLVGCDDDDNIKSIGPASNVPANPGESDSDNDDSRVDTSPEPIYTSSNYDPETQGSQDLPDYSDQGYAYGEYVYDDDGYDLYLYREDGSLYDHIRVDYRSGKETLWRNLTGPNKATIHPELAHRVEFRREKN